MNSRTRLRCVLEMEVDLEDASPLRAAEVPPTGALAEEAGVEFVNPGEEMLTLLTRRVLEAVRDSASTLGIHLHTASMTAGPARPEEGSSRGNFGPIVMVAVNEN